MTESDKGGQDRERGGGRARDKAGPIGAEATAEIGARLGGLLGGLTAALETLGAKLDEARRSGEGRGREGDHETVDVAFDTQKGPLNAKMGWRVRVGGLADGADDEADGGLRDGDAAGPRIRPGAGRAASAEAEPPLRVAEIEMFEEPDAVTATVDLPGVTADEIDVTVAEGALSLSTSGDRRFTAAAALPAEVDADAEPDMRLSNGVLEIRLSKRAEPEAREE